MKSLVDPSTSFTLLVPVHGEPFQGEPMTSHRQSESVIEVLRASITQLGVGDMGVDLGGRSVFVA